MAPHSYLASTISFDVDGDRVVGILRAPKADGPHPALLITGPLTSVKEQAAGCYAAALARRGFVTLAFDHRHFGESEGTPRQYEHPERKVEDARAASAFLAAHPDVDASKIGAVGVCAGAGYLSGAAATDARLGAFGVVAGFFHDAEQQRAWMGDGYDAAIAAATAARQDYERTGKAAQIPAVGQGDQDVAMPLDEAFEYYGTPRGAHPNYTNGFATMSREHTLPWSAQHFAPKITIPTLMVHSERALAPALARRWYAQLAGPKQEVWVDSEGQIDFYDDPARSEPAADALARHFGEHLGR